MWRKVFDTSQQQPHQTRKMWKVTGDRDVSRFRMQAVTNPLWRIVGLDVARRSQFRQRIARAPERLGRLLRAQLAAVPDDRRTSPASGGGGSSAIGLSHADG